MDSSTIQNNEATRETHLPPQDKDKELVDNPLDLTSQEKNDKESLRNILPDGKQLADFTTDLICAIPAYSNEMEKKEKPSLSPSDDLTTDAQKQADGLLDLNSSIEISSQEENNENIQVVGSGLTPQQRCVESMEKSDLSTDSENMEYIKVSDGDCPRKEQNFCNKVLGGVNCSRNEKEKSSESKGEKNPKVEEKQMISDDYTKKNVELVREELSEATST